MDLRAKPLRETISRKHKIEKKDRRKIILSTFHPRRLEETALQQLPHQQRR
jgi:hypothetical protein